MNVKWVGLVLFVWVCVMIGVSVSIGASTFDNTTINTKANDLLSFNKALITADWGTFVIGVMNGRFITSFFNLLTMDIPPFQNGGYWNILLLACWSPVVAMILFGIIAAFFALMQKTI